MKIQASGSERLRTIWWTQIGWDAIAYELKEFWPEVRRAVHKMLWNPLQ
jgi:hypothetical protein